MVNAKSLQCWFGLEELRKKCFTLGLCIFIYTPSGFSCILAMLTFERSLKYSNSHPYSGFKKTKKSCSSTEAPTQKKSPFYTQVITGTHIYENILQSASDIPLCVWLPGRYSTALQTSAYTKPDRKILNRRRETVAL